MYKMLLALTAGMLAAIGTGVAFTVTHPDVAPNVKGRYVEVRSAAVFAGGCHVNAEADHQGRRALMGFQLEEGRWLDEDLSGIDIAVAVASDTNLSDGGPRRSVVYIDESVTGPRRREAVAWLKDAYGDSLGEVEEVLSAPVTVRRNGQRFSIRVAGDGADILSVEGSSLPDLACCSMPESVWYEPLVDTENAVVGQATRCRFEGAGSIAAWTYEEQNNAFIGSFDDYLCARNASPSCCDIPARVALVEPMTGP
jgi:hypothetical protein